MYLIQQSLVKYPLRCGSYNKANGTYYSCNLNRHHFLHIPSPSARRRIHLRTDSSQLKLQLKLVAEVLVIPAWVILLLAHKVIIGFSHGCFVIMERASIQEILYSRDVHVAICDLLP